MSLMCAVYVVSGDGLVWFWREFISAWPRLSSVSEVSGKPSGLACLMNSNYVSHAAQLGYMYIGLYTSFLSR